jgi:hypothetical protein
VGTYKNQTGLDFDLCKNCPPEDLPRRATYSYVRGMSMSVFYPDPISSLVFITCGVSWQSLGTALQQRVSNLNPKPDLLYLSGSPDMPAAVNWWNQRKFVSHWLEFSAAQLLYSAGRLTWLWWVCPQVGWWNPCVHTSATQRSIICPIVIQWLRTWSAHWEALGCLRSSYRLWWLY